MPSGTLSVGVGSRCRTRRPPVAAMRAGRPPDRPGPVARPGVEVVLLELPGGSAPARRSPWAARPGQHADDLVGVDRVAAARGRRPCAARSPARARGDRGGAPARRSRSAGRSGRRSRSRPVGRASSGASRVEHVQAHDHLLETEVARERRQAAGQIEGGALVEEDLGRDEERQDPVPLEATARVAKLRAMRRRLRVASIEGRARTRAGASPPRVRPRGEPPRTSARTKSRSSPGTSRLFPMEAVDAVLGLGSRSSSNAASRSRSMRSTDLGVQAVESSRSPRAALGLEAQVRGASASSSRERCPA